MNFEIDYKFLLHLDGIVTLFNVIIQNNIIMS